MYKSIILIIMILCINIFAQVNLDSGLVAYYPFNGNANDESGNNNHGVVNGAILTMDRLSNDSSAYEFDGTASYISIPNSLTLQSPTTELSQVAWMYIYSWSLVGSQFGPILMKSNSGTNAFQYRMSVGSNGINTAINNWDNAVSVADTLNFNEWYMVASTLKNDTVKCYVNGLFIGKGVLTGPINSDSRPLEIGRDVPGLTEVFNGKIDEVRVYNRALNDLEIQTLAGVSTNISSNTIKLDKYELSQNYPNPFNPSTTIEFSIPKVEFVTLKIYNLLGQEMATLVSDKLAPDNYKYIWDASGLVSGIYYYKIEAGKFQNVKKLILLR